MEFQRNQLAMRLPLLHINPVQHISRTLTPSYVTATLNAPLFTTSEVVDTIDMPYGVDITVNDGFYVCIVCYLILRQVIRRFVQNT